MDIVVPGNRSIAMVHYWVRHAKCTWSSFFSSSVHQFIFSEIGDTELGLVYVLKINNIIKGAKEGVYCLGTAFCLRPVVLMIGDNSIMRSWQNPVCLLQYCVRSCHCCAILQYPMDIIQLLPLAH